MTAAEAETTARIARWRADALEASRIASSIDLPEVATERWEQTAALTSIALSLSVIADVVVIGLAEDGA